MLQFSPSSDFPFVSLLDGTWHHVCFTWENNDGNLTLYTDGLLIGQKQGVHQQLTFDSAGILDVGNFALNKSYLGDITDINAWTSVLTPSVINKQSRECFSEEGDLLAWSSVSAPYLQFGNELEVDSIPTQCKGFGKCRYNTCFLVSTEVEVVSQHIETGKQELIFFPVVFSTAEQAFSNSLFTAVNQTTISRILFSGIYIFPQIGDS